MRVYAVCIPELRTTYPSMEPPETFIPMGLFVASTNAQARSLAFKKWSQQPNSGVDLDDYMNLRARIIDWDAGWEDGEFWHSLPLGGVKESAHPYIQWLWNRWPEGWPAI